MKCPNCGAEIENTNYCEYCGSQITSEMKLEQEKLNKAGCPKCGSSNVSFKRENQGEVKGKNTKQVIHRTVGLCNDCGATWYADLAQKKRKTWLWVLGWIFIFPVPLTIILVKKKDMKPILRYGLIALAWIVYLAIGLSGGKGNETNVTPVSEPTSQQIETTTESPSNYLNETVSDESTSSQEPSKLSGIRPEFKEELEKYEAFFDEYIEFMDTYSKSDNTAALLLEYTEYMQKYKEAMEALDKMDEMEMSTEEAALYAEVTLRINSKLSKYAITN